MRGALSCGLLGLSFAFSASLVTAWSVLADEVLYCTDTAGTGFLWKGNAASPQDFTPERFTIKVVSAEKRVVSPESHSSYELMCTGIVDPLKVATEEGAISCRDPLGSEPWMFVQHEGASDTYTRAFLYGPPVGSGDPNIVIAYGTCAKF